VTPLVVPAGASDIDAVWLTSALAELSGGAQVGSVERRSIGNGMVADSVRLTITWDRPTAAPTSLVAKVPSTSPTSRQAAAATRTYLLEAAFYGELAGTLAVNRPLCYLSRYDEQTGNYVVLLEDLAPAQPGDQIAGCSVDQAATVMPELAALHGPRWNDPALLDLAWLDRPNPLSALGVAQLTAAVFGGFVERYQQLVEPQVMELAERFTALVEPYLTERSAPWTVVHGDFRLDNLLFGAPRVAVLDWQTVKLGPALSDVAYFIGSALQPAERRAVEADLVRSYHQALLSAGGSISWNECWHGYRLFGYDGLLMGIIASMLVGRTDRGDEMFMAMVNRHGQQLIDLDAEQLLPHHRR
jgi:Phosphotransferase enzyme family